VWLPAARDRRRAATIAAGRSGAFQRQGRCIAAQRSQRRADHGRRRGDRLSAALPRARPSTRATVAAARVREKASKPGLFSPDPSEQASRLAPRAKAWRRCRQQQGETIIQSTAAQSRAGAGGPMRRYVVPSEMLRHGASAVAGMLRCLG
jgi:hypothetical protein